MICGAAVSWKSKKQTCVALSTAEAEYVALASAIQEAIWIQKLPSNLKETPSKSATIYEGNQPAIWLAKNPRYHGLAKYIDIKYHFIREHIITGKIQLELCKSEEMVADVFTKGLDSCQFLKLRNMLGVKEIEEQSGSE